LFAPVEVFDCTAGIEAFHGSAPTLGCRHTSAYRTTLLEFDFTLHFLAVPFGCLDLPAVLSAMAMACFWGRPLFISVRIFCEIVFWDEPFLSGIGVVSQG
jgi:hypothetical protein